MAKLSAEEMKNHDALMSGVNVDGYPNCAEILLVYGKNELNALLTYEVQMNLISAAEEKGIKVSRARGSVFYDWSRALSDDAFDKVAEELEETYDLAPGIFTTLFNFAYGCEKFTDIEAKKLGLL